MTKVALLGPEGTYTHQAAERYFDDLEPVFCSSIREIFETVSESTIVPFENSLGGGVGESVDLLRESDDEITGEQRLRIEHCLLSRERNIEDIEKVRSHPQALTQCGDLIEKQDLEQIESSSTAKAAQELEENEAALASELAAEINDLNVLMESVQDTEENVTRFLILNGEKNEGEKTSIVLNPREDRPGLLHSMLGCFAENAINLSHIQSRPTKEKLGKYFFYIEAEEDSSSESFRKAINCLESFCEFEVLGSYEKGDLD